MEACRTEAGLSLLELLIVLIIGAILITLVGNAWGPLTERMKATTLQSNVHRAFTLARTLAVEKNTITTLCPLTPTGDCSNDWNQPVGIFLDPANNRRVLNDAALIKRLSLHTTGTLKPSNAPGGPRRYFQFSPDGSSRGTAGHLTWCPPSGQNQRARHVRINFGGRLLWSRDNNGDGIVEDANGRNVSC